MGGSLRRMMPYPAFDLSFVNVHRQYLMCRRNKRNTINALRFEQQQEKQLLQLYHELNNRTYTPSRSVCFFATKPKLREIFAADFKDRIVHHVLVDYLELIYEPKFVYDSYACRKKKGIHAGVNRLQTFIRQCGLNNKRPVWYLQLDIHNFFMSIDKKILFNCLKKQIKDDNALWLTELLVFHDCTLDYHLKGSQHLRLAIPEHKTLFKTALGKGLPIGNLNSQFFANVYLNELDQFVKHQLKCKHYVRYCDDFILLSHSRQQLEQWQPQIAGFIADKLQLKLNNKQKLTQANNGIDFLGYIVRSDYKLIRRRVVNHLKQKLKAFEKQLVVKNNQCICYDFNESVLEQLYATLSSYLGHLKWGNSFNLIQSIWQEFVFLRIYFEIDFKALVLSRRYLVPKNFKRVAQQYFYFRWLFKECILLFKVGKFYEFYHEDDVLVANALGLKRMGKNFRGAKFGFSVIKLMSYMKAISVLNKRLCFVDEQGVQGNKLQRRHVSFYCYCAP